MSKRAKGNLWQNLGLSVGDFRTAAKRIAEAAPIAQEAQNRLRDFGRRVPLVPGWTIPEFKVDSNKT